MSRAEENARSLTRNSVHYAPIVPGRFPFYISVCVWSHNRRTAVVYLRVRRRVPASSHLIYKMNICIVEKLVTIMINKEEL